MAGYTIGSLFSGYGGLDLGVTGALGPGDTLFVSNVEKGPCAVLAHRYPDAPNIGDITRVDWRDVPRVDVLCGGSPCTDLSTAGARAGMTKDTRSGLWESMFRGVQELRPHLVVWENVLGATSARAFSLLEQREGRVGAEGGRSRADIGGPDRAHVARGLLSPRGVDLLPTPQATVSTYSSQGYGPNLNEVAVTLMPTPKASDGEYGLPRTSGRPPEKSAHLATRLAYTDYGVYAEAIARWERVTGRRATSPTEPAARAGGRPRLSAVFVEWMMGLPEGWVTAPEIGLSRSAALRALGNGVVPQQASAAVASLLERERTVGESEGWPEFAS